jgi:hypothetical protein
MPFLLRLVLDREPAVKKFAVVLDLIIITIVLGAATLYVLSSIVTRPTSTNDIEYTELLNRGELLYRHGCQCKNDNIRYGDILTYAYDGDYKFCIEKMPNISNTFASIYCITATYKLQSMINGSWSFSQDSVISQNKLVSDVRNEIKDFTFDAWNLLSDSLQVARELTLAFLKGHVLLGNETDFNVIAGKTYDSFVNNEFTVDILVDRMMSSLTFNNPKYLLLCEPENCKIVENTSLIPMLLAIIGILGGYISSLTNGGNTLLKFVDDRYVESLVEKLHRREITTKDKSGSPQEKSSICFHY